MAKNITLAIDEDLLNRARIFAATRGTTVNGMVRDLLARAVDGDDRLAEARRRLRDLMDGSTADLGPGYVWSREEIYADRLLPRHERPDLRRRGEDE